MKIVKYLVICMLLVSTIGFTIPVLAHPPLDMELNYSLDKSEITVTITHETPAPSVHYVNKVDIELNDVIIISEDYTSQPTNDVFTYVYTVDADVGDLITVTAYCNIQGSITRSITVNDPTQDDPPIVEIKNPTKGYFHFSGIRLFATYLDLVYDTMGFGGFRVKPVQASITDDNDEPEDLIVTLYANDIKERDMAFNSESGLFEGKWIGPDLGVFTMKITAEDSFGNIAIAEMDVWYFCFVPEN